MGDSDAAWLSCCPLQVKQTPLQASRASASFWASSVSSPCLRCAAATTCASNSPCTCTRVSAVVPLTLLLPGGQATRFSARVYLRATAVALEINTRSPVRPRRCNYTTPPARKNNIPPTTEIKSHQIRAAAVWAQENTSWRADKRGVTAGGDPSGSRRSISIQNHAYDFDERHSLSVSNSGWFSSNRQRNCVICVESAGENEALTWDSGLLPVAQTHIGCYAGCGEGNLIKINCHHGQKVVLADLQSILFIFGIIFAI